MRAQCLPISCLHERPIRKSRLFLKRCVELSSQFCRFSFLLFLTFRLDQSANWVLFVIRKPAVQKALRILNMRKLPLHSHSSAFFLTSFFRSDKASVPKALALTGQELQRYRVLVQVCYFPIFLYLMYPYPINVSSKVLTPFFFSPLMQSVIA